MIFAEFQSNELSVCVMPFPARKVHPDKSENNTTGMPGTAVF